MGERDEMERARGVSGRELADRVDALERQLADRVDALERQLAHLTNAFAAMLRGKVIEKQAGRSGEPDEDRS